MINGCLTLTTAHARLVRMKKDAPGLTAVVVADAPAADLRPFEQLVRQADLLIAADGGARYLLAFDIVPHIAVGDFDSLDVEVLDRLVQSGVKVERHSVHKNETDLELALLRAIERGAKCVHVLAALGGRPDQHLANLQLLTHPSLAQVDVRLLHRGWEIFAVRDQIDIIGAPQDIVSLLPMTEEVSGIVTEGLFYPLRNETLRLGPARGVSNVMTSTSARVTVGSGILLGMHQLSDGSLI